MFRKKLRNLFQLCVLLEGNAPRTRSVLGANSKLWPKECNNDSDSGCTGLSYEIVYPVQKCFVVGGDKLWRIESMHCIAQHPTHALHTQKPTTRMPMGHTHWKFIRVQNHKSENSLGWTLFSCMPLCKIERYGKVILRFYDVTGGCMRYNRRGVKQRSIHQPYLLSKLL